MKKISVVKFCPHAGSNLDFTIAARHHLSEDYSANLCCLIYVKLLHLPLTIRCIYFVDNFSDHRSSSMVLYAGVDLCRNKGLHSRGPMGCQIWGYL